MSARCSSRRVQASFPRIRKYGTRPPASRRVSMNSGIGSQAMRRNSRRHHVQFGSSSIAAHLQRVAFGNAAGIRDEREQAVVDGVAPVRAQIALGHHRRDSGPEHDGNGNFHRGPAALRSAPAARESSFSAMVLPCAGTVDTSGRENACMLLQGLMMISQIRPQVLMDGDQVVDGSPSSASGTGAFLLDSVRRTLEYRLTYQCFHGAGRHPRPMKLACNSGAASGTEVGSYLVLRARISVGPAALRAPRTVARRLVRRSTHPRFR